MFCIVAFIVLALLGIFSATHRKLAREAFGCVIKRVTLKKCDTGFSEKVRGKILARLLQRSEKAAKIFNKYFELLSWIFFILMVWSLVSTIIGAVNFYKYGNCNGLNEEGFCIFDPTGSNNKVSSVEETCSLEPMDDSELTIDYLNTSLFPFIDNSSENEVVFIGCYACDYSRDTWPVMEKLLKKKEPNFIFIHFPVKGHTDYVSNYTYCAFSLDKEKFWGFNSKLFEIEPDDFGNENVVKDLAEEQGYDMEKLTQCVNDNTIKNLVAEQFKETEQTNIYGTPTVFVNGEPVVGPKPYRVYKRMLK